MHLHEGSACTCSISEPVLLQNTYPDKIQSWRHVVYTCFQPRHMASAHDLKLKAQAWDKYQITTHLPAENIRVYDENFAKRTLPSVSADYHHSIRWHC